MKNVSGELIAIILAILFFFSMIFAGGYCCGSSIVEAKYSKQTEVIKQIKSLIEDVDLNDKDDKK